MFSGIVGELGRVESVDSSPDGTRLRVRAPQTASATRPGDSVAVNGVCLTATMVAEGVVSFHAVPETVSRSALGRLRAGGAVNIEAALRAGDPLGGHIVQGHVDGVGRVRAVEPDGEGRRLEVELPRGLERYCVEKGSVAVDGVSLTIAGLDGGTVSIALVPHTLAATTLGSLAPGDEVNIEVDVLAKYVERLLAAR